MSRRTISQHEMDRRLLVAKAVSTVYDAMMAATEVNGELSGIEWLSVLNTVTTRILGTETVREWTGSCVECASKASEGDLSC